MKKFSSHLLLPFCFFLFLFISACNNNSGGGSKSNTAASSLVPLLQSKVDPTVVSGFTDMMNTFKNDPLSIEQLGHYAYLSRQLETAAWLYAIVADKKPDNYLNLSNLGLCLHELSLIEPDPKTSTLLQQAIDLLEKAAAGDPQNGAIQNNLGYALYQQYKNNNDPAVLKKAEESLLKAIQSEPKNAIYHSHLADIYAAMNKNEDAVSHLNEAFRLEPLNGVFINSAANIPAFAASKNSRNYCDSINYDCMHTCPPSIIGRLELISCEMAQQDARMACGDGKPYADSYDCDDQMPASGFLIPGLNSGFTILTPFGKLSILVQGKGRIDFKFDIKDLPGMPPKLKFNFEGKYDPKSGMSMTKFGPSISIYSYKNGPVSEDLSKFGVAPVSVKIELGKETNVVVQSYGTPVVHIH